MSELAPGIHALGHAKGGHVHAFLIGDGGELSLVDTLFEDNARLVLEAIRGLARDVTNPKRIASARRLAALEPEIVRVGHGDPITRDAAERVHGLVA